METHAERHKPANSQLIFVPHKDTARLLEVYVRRSLSLNDGAVSHKKSQKKEKWVTVRKRRHSSDPSLHLAVPSDEEEIEERSLFEPSDNQPEPCVVEGADNSGKKNKKPSFWKNLFEFFSRKSSEDKDEEQESPAETSEASDAAITCLPTAPITPRNKSSRKKSIIRRFSKKRLSLVRQNTTGKELNAADITGVEAVVSVEPTYSYYENVTTELEKIVREVKEKEEDKPLSKEELINRIIALTKEQGDAIDAKLKDNPTLNTFFQGMTYSSFQKLADAYLEEEATPTIGPPTVPPTAPELVKLAFTLEFTAQIAGLSKQNVGHIKGLGKRYLQDRFEYTQACTDHPWSDSDD
ncbi:uncharacterized protein LOC115387870 [Salarias fasciatus]|uniref:uncharacterized protein LOC115387870 n=1 Tax=Salarias fasciatus TaxID=181472 RepID=UPI0011766160|nr:uncharacterized protein LOC115387870 [Salarias fasciatus]